MFANNEPRASLRTLSNNDFPPSKCSVPLKDLGGIRMSQQSQWSVFSPMRTLHGCREPSGAAASINPSSSSISGGGASASSRLLPHLLQQSLLGLRGSPQSQIFAVEDNAGRPRPPRPRGPPPPETRDPSSSAQEYMDSPTDGAASGLAMAQATLPLAAPRRWGSGVTAELAAESGEATSEAACPLKLFRRAARIGGARSCFIVTDFSDSVAAPGNFSKFCRSPFQYSSTRMRCLVLGRSFTAEET